MKEIQPVSISATTDTPNISRLIYTIRNQQVMLASDLAMLYQVETRVLNQAVKRNQKRFPERYCFQLTKEEMENLTSQFVMSSSAHGGRRVPPYVFTEQGIAMLSAILRSDVAIDVSIRIMDAFVEMRHFIAGNAHLFERIERVELKQLTYQKEANENIQRLPSITPMPFTIVSLFLTTKRHITSAHRSKMPERNVLPSHFCKMRLSYRNFWRICEKTFTAW